MAGRQSIPIRPTLRKLFPAALVASLVRACGAVQRMREVDSVELFWTVVLGLGVGRERTVAGLESSRAAVRRGWMGVLSGCRRSGSPALSTPQALPRRAERR